MAAGIEQHDYMFSANGIRPWHGLGTVIQEAPTSEDALRIAQLDWDVIQEPLCFGTKKTGYVEIPGMFSNVRNDIRESVGVISKKYRVVQNREAFAFIDDIMAQKDIPCRYETAGSLFNGKRVWMLVKMPEADLLGDKVERYLWFSNSHDGGTSCKAGISTVRVVCNNTLNAALLASPRVWSFRHMGDIEKRKREAMITLGLATDYFDELHGFADKMAAKKVNVVKFVESLIPIDTEDSERVQKNRFDLRNNIIDIAMNKNDLQNFKGTAWGIWNAVADVESNSAPLRMTDTFQRGQLIDFMDGSKLLEKAERILLAA